jgi:hypothetical protein
LQLFKSFTILRETQREEKFRFRYTDPDNPTASSTTAVMQ